MKNQHIHWIFWSLCPTNIDGYSTFLTIFGGSMNGSRLVYLGSLDIWIRKDQLQWWFIKKISSLNIGFLDLFFLLILVLLLFSPTGKCKLTLAQTRPHILTVLIEEETILKPTFPIRNPQISTNPKKVDNCTWLNCYDCCWNGGCILLQSLYVIFMFRVKSKGDWRVGERCQKTRSSHDENLTLKTPK